MIVRLANETGRVFRYCSLLGHCFQATGFGENALRGDFVDCAEGNSIARLQAAGTGKAHLPSNDTDGTESEVVSGPVVSDSKYCVMCTCSGSGNEEVVSVVDVSSTWTCQSLPLM